MAKYVKYRAWRFLAYPENIKDDWQAQLNLTGLKWARSPFHDQDVKMDGTPVPPHWHLIIIWPGPTTDGPPKQIAAECGFKIPPLRCDYPVEAFKYFTHDEHSDKVKYLREDILMSENFTPDDLPEIKKEEEDEIISLIKGIIRDRNIFNSWTLDEVLESDSDIRLWRYFRCHSLYFNSMLKGRRDLRSDKWAENKARSEYIEKIAKEGP